MELILYITVMISLFLFGYFLANEEMGELWSFIGVIGIIIISSLAVAAVDQDPDAITMTFHSDFIYSTLRLCCFVLGFQVGYPRKRPYWKRTLIVNVFAVVFLLVYLVLL